jgi:NADH:ubiquinone oxidoreductase subunit 4 (subunit M)
MDSIFKADAFFFITSLAVIIATAVFIVIAVYIIKIVRNVKNISDQAKEETTRIVEDIREVRATSKSKIKGLVSLLGVVPTLVRKMKKK